MTTPSRRLLWMALVISAIPTIAQAADADEVLDTIEEGVQLYKEGDYSEAVSSLNYAVQLIQQKKGGALEALLPSPLPGWTAQDSSSQAAGSAMFGGGVTAERTYLREDQRVQIQIVADSPMLQGMMMMFTNPMFATSQGGKLERIGRQKVIVKYDAAASEGDITAVVANRYLITVEGSNVSKDDLSQYAEAIDYAGIAKLP